MSFNPYLYEKSIAERHSQILHDMEQSQMLAHHGQRPTFVRSTVGRFGSLLVELGSQLQRSGERGEASVHS